MTERTCNEPHVKENEWYGREGDVWPFLGVITMSAVNTTVVALCIQLTHERSSGSSSGRGRSIIVDGNVGHIATQL